MRISAAFLACIVIATPIARAAPDAFARESIPRKWLNNVIPENLPPLEYPAYYSALERAKMEAFRGRYKMSLMTLLGVKDGDPVEIALIKATSLAATARRERALQALADPAIANNPAVQMKRAEILVEQGKLKEALELVKSHLEQHKDSIAGRYWLGAIQEQLGDLKAATSAYEWFTIEPQDYLQKWQRQRERAFKNAEEATLIGRAIDRWATLTGSYEHLPQLNDSLSALFIRIFDVMDRSYWPAHVAAAEFFLARDDTRKAIMDLTAANEANPNDPRLNEIMGKIAIEQWNFDGGEQQADLLRIGDPDSVAADLMETRNLLQQRRPEDAQRPVERVLAKQPENLEALGLLAATYALRLQDEKTAEVLKRVEALDADNASAYLEVAEQLGAMRQYPRSAAMYKVAIERAPWWTAARNGLGLLYTQWGDEKLAKETIDVARRLDPYNLRTTNYLRLLDELETFAQKETPHFVIMYDAKLDPIIPEYFVEYLESIHAEVCKTYATEPKDKTYIEVFPTHDAFSVRTTGSPWIGTVGASTGKVIAMVAPRKGEATMGAFNWAQVLRHEYTHTVTLAATDNRIPHWMTEGLAVVEEQAPLKWDWIPMLYDAVTKKELFTMENLTWGFVRPRRPQDRSLAYAQSHWVCKYIGDKYGHDAILKMLNEFKNGSSEKDAFQKVLNKPIAEFQTEFFAWTDAQVASWGYDEATTAKYEKLREQGEELIRGAKYTEAVTVWEEIGKLRPVDPLPHQRLAGLYLHRSINQPAKAIEHLKALHAVELKNNAYAKRIAQVYRDSNQLGDALAYAMQSVYIDPYDLSAHNLLLEIGEKSSNQTIIDREKRVIPILKQWIEDTRPKPLPS